MADNEQLKMKAEKIIRSLKLQNNQALSNNQLLYTLSRMTTFCGGFNW